jgi:hypothetical protein
MLIAIAIIFYAGLVGPWWLGFIALIPVATAAAFYCPIWDLVGINTYQESPAHQ